MNELNLNRWQQEALQKLKIENLTPMQEAALFACREPNDMVLLSPTGSGKTLAYLVPLLERLKEDNGEVQALVIVPSRELAMQIESVFKSMMLPWKAMSCYGGRPAMDEHRSMEGIHPSLIVGTPGRLNDHLDKRNFTAETVKTLIIDEFDKCLELGFHDEMAAILQKLPSVERRYLLSATDSEQIPEFTGLQRMVKLNYLDSDIVSERIHTYLVPSESKDKLLTLYRLLCQLDGGQTIVFCNHRESVERVGNYLAEQKLPHEIYHGGMEQDLRERALYKFRNGSSNVLVSTDLASRGLDIPEVQNIVHYHLPLNEEAYIHRTGRTARWTATGNSFLILHAEEEAPDYLPAGVETFALSDKPCRPQLPVWVTLYIGKGKKDKLNKVDVAGFLYKKGQLVKEDIGGIDVQDYYAYVAVKRNKVRQLLSLVRDEKIKGMKTCIDIAK